MGGDGIPRSIPMAPSYVSSAMMIVVRSSDRRVADEKKNLKLVGISAAQNFYGGKFAVKFAAWSGRFFLAASAD